jgi:AraC-like DNA-binding protein
MLQLTTLFESRAESGTTVRLMTCGARESACLQVENAGAALGFSCCFAGDMLCSIPGAGYSNRVVGGQSGIWGTPAVGLCVRFQKGTHRWLDVLIDRKFIGNILQDAELSVDTRVKNLFLRTDAPFTLGTKASDHTLFLAGQIVNCPFEGVMRKYYIESKGLELILEEIGRHFPRRVQRGGCCTNRKRIEEAWRMLVDDLENPRTIAELACNVGMSASTLKRSFQRLYGTSIFAFYQNYRMVQARNLLEGGGLNVTEVAFKVGYANSSHFSRAFHRHFGVPPKLCRGGTSQLTPLELAG